MEMLLRARSSTALDFDVSTTRYRGQNALALARISMLAYKDNAVMERAIADKFAFTHFKVFKAGETEAYLISDSEKIIVTFRGSDQVKDWLNNIDIDLVGGPLGGKVHEGFMRMFHGVWRELQLEIRALKTAASQQNRSLPLWMTGHSLGAALATLATAYLREKDQPVQGLYSFGSPRVGDRTFARHFDSDFGDKTFRIVNKNDIVTRLPPRALSYSHVGQLYFFDGSGQLQTDSSVWYRFLDSVKVHVADLFDMDFRGWKITILGPMCRQHSAIATAMEPECWIRIGCWAGWRL
ncbi:MAG: lipase family protein [Synechococcales cyanobacterium RM1_1_8]|nr:lipase family protein [Synechococcales cyanobacterium RM1_1_8]